MDDVTVDYAKVHLEDLIARAQRGEEVRITGLKVGGVVLRPLPRSQDAPRKPRRLGLLEGKMTVPARLMEPMSDDELRDWYGDDV